MRGSGSGTATGSCEPCGDTAFRLERDPKVKARVRGFFARLPFFVLAFLFLAVALPVAGQEEKPVNPDSLGGSSFSLFGERKEGYRLQINGFAVGGFGYDFRTDENSFEDSAIAVSFFRPVSDRVSFFGQLALHREEEGVFADDAESLTQGRLGQARGEEGDEEEAFETEIDNLQVAWAANPDAGLQVVFGKFDSPLGIERDDAPLNFQATSSFVFRFARPVKFTGLLIRKAFSPHFEGFAILANGWDISRDKNRAKTGALYALWSPSLRSHAGLGVIAGSEKEGRTGDARTTAVVTLLFQPSDNWAWGDEFVFGREPHSAGEGGTAEWLGNMFFTHQRLGKHWAVTLRADYLDDRNGSRTGRRQVLRSLTLSPQYLIGGGFFGIYRTLERTTLRLPEVALRVDLRLDRSSERVFRRKEEGERRDSFSATGQVVYVF